MRSISRAPQFRACALSAAVAGTLMALCAPSFALTGPVTVKGVLAGSHFTPPNNADNPSSATASVTTASVYQSAKVCFDANNNGVCDAGETSAFTKADGSFLLTGRALAPLVAEVPTTATNSGYAVTERLALRVAADQITAASTGPLVPVTLSVTPLATEVARMMDADGLTFQAARQQLADRLGVSVNDVLSDPNTIADETTRNKILNESVILTGRFTLAAKMVDRGDVSAIKDAQQAAMNIEGIPRYDHIFVIMLENKATSSIAGSAYAPKINAWPNAGNQFTSYFATGNPSEPNYTALGGADDFGITDDSQWNCDATGANAVQDLPVPDNTQPGLAKSPFTKTCTQSAAVNHNITGRANLFNALTSKGMAWRTYSESMNPGQDFRIDSVADSAVVAKDHVYAPGTVANNTAAIGSATLNLPLPAGLYKTKHHPGMAYQNVRSAVEFKSSNRTMGGGQWDGVMMNSKDYAIPAGYDIDQLGTDLASGDIGQVNFLVPDQCDDMHGITLTGTDTATGKSGTASDCSSVANNVSPTSVAPIITRGDNYTDAVIRKVQASPIWQNPNKRVAIVIMFDEGNATSGFNSCCGWNPAATSLTTVKPLVQLADGTFSKDATVNNYYKGNHGHGESVFGVLTNQVNAPKGLKDSDAYSHFSFVRTLQDMFGLADPAVDGSYMNRSKYTEKFIAANLLNLPEFAGSADTHFDSVRPMNHAYVIPAGRTAKQSSDVNTTAQVGPDSNQVNLWSLK
ncbi:MAG: phosphoesterase [Aquabacterium sp.]